MLSLFGFIVSQVSRTVTQYWLTIVTESAKILNGTEISHHLNVSDSLREGYIDQIFNFSESEINNKGGTPDRFDVMSNMTIYAYLVGSSLIVITAHLILFYVICTKSSINIHNGMARAILKAPMHFFDRNPIGNELQSFFYINM